MRTLKKTTTFAVVHFSVAFAVTYALTGSLPVAGAVALLEPACNTVAYFIHEKLWAQRGGGSAGAGPDIGCSHGVAAAMR